MARNRPKPTHDAALFERLDLSPGSPTLSGYIAVIELEPSKAARERPHIGYPRSFALDAFCNAQDVYVAVYYEPAPLAALGELISKKDLEGALAQCEVLRKAGALVVKTEFVEFLINGK